MRGNIIYDEMGFFAKLIRNRRIKFLHEKKNEYFEWLNRYNEKAKLSNDDDTKKHLYKYTILNFLYETYYMSGFSSNLQDVVIAKSFNWMHWSHDVRSPNWQKALEELKTNRVVVELLPKIFTPAFADEWERRKPAKIQAEKEQQERRAGLERVISSLESELSRLKSMFSSMSGFSRTQISVSMDVTETRLNQFKAELASLS